MWAKSRPSHHQPHGGERHGKAMYRGKTAHREEPIITCAFGTPFCRDASRLDQLRQQRGSILRIGWHQFLNSALHNTTTRLDRIFITASSRTTMTR